MEELIRQLKRAGALRSPHVEAAFRAVDRADFVPPAYQNQAYDDHPLPIGEGQTISQPSTVAFMLDLLDPKPGERILDIGFGSGWTSALLAAVVSRDERAADGPRGRGTGSVYALERIPALCARGKKNVAAYRFAKRGIVEFFCRDGTAGLPEEAPFDAILASAAAVRDIPPAWRRQVRTGGRIVAPVDGSVRRYTKQGQTAWTEEEFPGFAFVPLVSERTDDQKPETGNREPNGHAKKHGWAALVLASGFLFTAIAAYALLAPVPLDEPVRLEIASGSGSRAIAGLLKERGVVRSKWLLIGYTAIIGAARDLKPGSYEFRGSIAIPALVAELVRGGPYERTITIPEGWARADISSYFASEGLIPLETFHELTGPGSAARLGARFELLRDAPAEATLEGYLFPDTYRLYRDAAPADIVEKMLENFGRKITPDLRGAMTRQGRTVYAVVTMASLIEKEVAGSEDRRLVAGILWKRMGSGIPLQVDATVNFVTGKRKTPSAADLAINSPYNTYRHRGLPPGPIANPGLDAIDAALFPQPSRYLYYLSAGDGRTIFSQTLQEHGQAKARYLGR